MRETIVAVAFLLCTASIAMAQIHVGGAFIITIQPADADAAGTFAPPPGGSAPAVSVFGGVALGKGLSLEGEFSTSKTFSTTRKESYYGGDFTATSEHHDVIVTGLLRWGGRRLPFDVLGGLSLVWPRTDATSTFTDRFSGAADTLSMCAPSSTQVAPTFGIDFPIPLNSRVSILPSMRFYVIRRPDLEFGLNGPQPIGSPGEGVLHFGVGVKIAL